MKMSTQLYIYLLLIGVTLTLANEDDIKLPPCPRIVQYMPQDLPMHCRMPRNADGEQFNMPEMPNFPNMPTDSPYPFYQSLPPGKQPLPMPIPIPPFPPLAPGMPGGAGMPPGLPPGMPMPMPMPMPIPAGPAHKLPVIVMPFYSPDVHSYSKSHHHSKKHPHKHRQNHYSSNETEVDSSSSKSESESDGSDDEGWWKGKGRRKKKSRGKYGIYRRFNRHRNVRRRKKKPDLLTPILQYVTKDGYVIFEKKISKSEASDWIGPKEEEKVNEEETAAKKEVEILEEPEPKVEVTTEDALKEETPKIKIKDSESLEINEMNELPTEKPRKRNRKRKIKFTHGADPRL